MAGPDMGDDGEDGHGDVGVVEKTKPKTKRPSLYKVLIGSVNYP